LSQALLRAEEKKKDLLIFSSVLALPCCRFRRQRTGGKQRHDTVIQTPQWRRHASCGMEEKAGKTSDKVVVRKKNDAFSCIIKIYSPILHLLLLLRNKAY
jgi:hypothetical protein